MKIQTNKINKFTNLGVLLLVSLLGSVVVIGTYFTFASPKRYVRNYITLGNKQNVHIPGYTKNSWTKAGITTFGGKCENADNGISFFDGKKYRSHGTFYAALRIMDNSGSSTKDQALRNKITSYMRKGLTHSRLIIRRRTGTKNGKPVYKALIARLDDWGPSYGVVRLAKKSAKKRYGVTIRTVVDVSPEIADYLGLHNDDATCTVDGKKIYETAIGASEGQPVEVAFYW